MSDSRAADPSESGLDKGTGDPNDDRAFLEDLPPAQVQDDDEGDGNDEADAGA